MMGEGEGRKEERKGDGREGKKEKKKNHKRERKKDQRREILIPRESVKHE